MVINNNQITVTEYNVSGNPTILCSNQPLVYPSNNGNPYLLSFSCGVQANTYRGTWYLMPLSINNETALMISEYIATSNSAYSITNEIAFLQSSFTPSGTYNYVYNGIGLSQAGIKMASFNNNSLINTVVGTCAGAACAIINGQYFSNSDTIGNVMQGFDYYNVNGLSSYNLVGSTSMNLFVDSFSGIYF
jgi:hypothetical protein